MKAVLISTYDLGRQPFGLASPAAWLRRAGAHVTCEDLSVERLDEDAVRAADLVAFYLPMHTATRIAARIAPHVKALNPRAHLSFYGLYAPMNVSLLRSLGADTIFGGEFEEGLASLARRLMRDPRNDGSPWAAQETDAPGAPGPAVAGAEPAPAVETGTSETAGASHLPLRGDEIHVSLARQRFLTPDRENLPPLSRYARLHSGDGTMRTVGYTEASRGCRHLCRHCPIVPVYRGVFRIVQRDVVIRDVDQQVERGAEHITFGDPDFFNGVGHALEIVRELHARHEDLTYDVTIKIEHLLRHARHAPELRATGCLFVTSAVESIDDHVLEILDKGHTRRGFLEAARLLNDTGLVFNPTFIPFNPWTTLDGYLELLDLLAEMDLAEHVAPIQLAIRLLIPAGSKLLELPEVRAMVGPFDDVSLVHPWRHADPHVDRLQTQIESMVEEEAARGESRLRIFEQVRRLAERAAAERAAAERADGPHASPDPASRTGGRVARSQGATPRIATPIAQTTSRPAVSTSPWTVRTPIPYLTEPWYC